MGNGIIRPLGTGASTGSKPASRKPSATQHGQAHATGTTITKPDTTEFSKVKQPEVQAQKTRGNRVVSAVAKDPTGTSLHHSTLDMLKNPPKDASGFGAL